MSRRALVLDGGIAAQQDVIGGVRTTTVQSVLAVANNYHQYHWRTTDERMKQGNNTSLPHGDRR